MQLNIICSCGNVIRKTFDEVVLAGLNQQIEVSAGRCPKCDEKFIQDTEAALFLGIKPAKTPKKQVAFMCYPYSAPTDFERRQNIEAAARDAAKVWALGYAVICPQMNSAFLGGCTDEQDFYNGYEELLRRSDFLVLGVIKNSKGCRKEIQLATSLRKPIKRLQPDGTLKDINKDAYEMLNALNW